jgi:SAM-dependent methyltransferase
MVLRYHEIAEANHRILNPFTAEKLQLLGEVCRLRPGDRILDLCCGKGELLCTWSRDHRIEGVGVDISEVFLAAARARASELGLGDRVRFVHADASVYRDEQRYDIGCCIGATWIGNGPGGTIELLRPQVRDGGLILIGEPYWIEGPTPEAEEALGEGFTTLIGLLDCFTAHGTELVEMVLADGDSWDRYVAAQWWTAAEWLREHPDHPDHTAMREFLEEGRRSHLQYGRKMFGWGVFVLRLR